MIEFNTSFSDDESSSLVFEFDVVIVGVISTLYRSISKVHLDYGKKCILFLDTSFSSRLKESYCFTE